MDTQTSMHLLSPRGHAESGIPITFQQVNRCGKQERKEVIGKSGPPLEFLGGSWYHDEQKKTESLNAGILNDGGILNHGGTLNHGDTRPLISSRKARSLHFQEKWGESHPHHQPNTPSHQNHQRTRGYSQAQKTRISLKY